MTMYSPRGYCHSKQNKRRHASSNVMKSQIAFGSRFKEHLDDETDFQVDTPRPFFGNTSTQLPTKPSSISTSNSLFSLKVRFASWRDKVVNL
jgi:hypothetical protein